MIRLLPFWFFSLLISTAITAQDKIIKSNNEEVQGKVIRFKDGKFTLLLYDKSELTFPKDAVKEILFDTLKSSLVDISLNTIRDKNIDPECDKKKVGNLQFSETTQEVTLVRIWNDGFNRSYQFSKNNSPFTVFNIPEGFYYWEVYSLKVSGSFYLHKCNTKQIEIK